MVCIGQRSNAANRFPLQSHSISTLTNRHTITNTTVPTAEITKQAAPRAHALDVLRGAAVLLMIFAGVIPFDQPLPVWMYHAQEPPPYHNFNPNLPGMTWVDLIFPVFLFAMGAAIPLALSARLDREKSVLRTVARIFERGILLVFFALYIQHIRPETLVKTPHNSTWLLSLLGFALLFPLFSRFPKKWSRPICLTVRLSAYVVAALLLSQLHYPKGARFSLDRADIILLVLANMAVFGSLIWLATRRSMLARLAPLAILLAMRFSQKPTGWVHSLWNWGPHILGWDMYWLFRWEFVCYLFIIMPGTICGDLLLEWSRSKQSEDALTEERLPEEISEALSGKSKPSVPVRKQQIALLALLCLLIAPIALIGLETRRLLPMTLTLFLASALAIWLAQNLMDATGRLVRACVQWGAFWLTLGLTFEPFEGGIKKDHPTLSYYFVCTGLALFLLSALTILLVKFKGRRWFGLLEDVGKNPMIGYCAMSNLILPLLALTGLDIRLADMLSTPWLGVLRGALETLLLALVVRLCSRLGIFWKT